MEVEATISNVIGLKDATSYGVEIPGTDGNYSLVTNKNINHSNYLYDNINMLRQQY